MIRNDTINTRGKILEMLYKNKQMTRYEIGIALGMPAKEIEEDGKIHQHLLDMLSQKLINRPSGAGIAGNPYQHEITKDGEAILRFLNII